MTREEAINKLKMDNTYGDINVMKRDMIFFLKKLEMNDEDCNLDFLMTEQIIAGDVDYALERLDALIEETGEFGTLCLMSYDWDDKSAWLRSMELFADELMPRLNAKYS